MTWNKFKTFFFSEFIGACAQEKVKRLTKPQLLEGDPESPFRMSCRSSKKACTLWASPPSLRPGKHLLITEVTSVWTFHSFRIHGTDWMHVFLNIYILTEGPGTITNMDNSPQHRTRLPTTQFKFNSQLPMDFNPGGEQVKTSERNHYLTRFWKDGKTRVPNWSRWVLPRTGHVTLFLACPWVRGHQGI